MNLEFNSPNPISLISDIIKRIEDNKLQTWKIHLENDKKYLKHIGQWSDKGVIKLTADSINNKMKVQVFKFEKVEVDVEDFEGYYYGRFCELIFVNFTNRFTSIDKK